MAAEFSIKNDPQYGWIRAVCYQYYVKDEIHNFVDAFQKFYQDFGFTDKGDQRLKFLFTIAFGDLERENKNKTSLYYVIVVSSSSSMAARYQTCN